MPITLTEKAVQEVKNVMTNNKVPESGGLRVGAKGGGCSGFTYTMSLEMAPAEGDQVELLHGVKIFCDPKSYDVLNGMVIDWQESLQGKGFVFQNPNASHTCGCGQSFSV